MCQNVIEKLIHIFQCPHIHEAWVKFLLQFSKWFDITKTSSIISSTIIGALLTMSSFSSNLPLSAPQIVVRAAYEQDEIGMFGFLSGKIATTWVDAYSCLKKATKSKYQVRSKWGSHLIKKTFAYAYQVWKARSNKVHEVLD